MAPKRTGRDAIAWAMSEAELQANIISACEPLGYLVCHVRPAQMRDGRWVTPTTAKGFPDLHIVGRGRIIVAELKDERRKVEPDQEVWLKEYAKAGAETYVWRPHHWLNDTILNVLRSAS